MWIHSYHIREISVIIVICDIYGLTQFSSLVQEPYMISSIYVDLFIASMQTIMSVLAITDKSMTSVSVNI